MDVAETSVKYWINNSSFFFLTGNMLRHWGHQCKDVSYFLFVCGHKSPAYELFT